MTFRFSRDAPQRPFFQSQGSLSSELGGPTPGTFDGHFPTRTDPYIRRYEAGMYLFRRVRISRFHESISPDRAASPIFGKRRVCLCICRDMRDDGFLIMCIGCQSWQHIKCYYPGSQSSSQLSGWHGHLCAACKPYLSAIEREPGRLERDLRGFRTAFSDKVFAAVPVLSQSNNTLESSLHNLNASQSPDYWAFVKLKNVPKKAHSRPISPDPSIAEPPRKKRRRSASR